MGYLSSCNAESAIATCDPYHWDRKKCWNNTNPTRDIPSCNPIKVRDFTYDDLLSATNGFSADSFLGKGSHGTVYRASLDDGNLIAAVKKTSTHSNSTAAPADNEIEVLSRVRHPRLVNLIGFGKDPDDRKLLVVEYMPNGSLHGLLHSSCRPPGWTSRVRFALQVAQAVQAIHSSDPPVIHRDIKSSNVLIDEKWGARLGDFGLALRGQVEDVRVKCTPPAGTMGYLDPAYLAPGDLSSKSDVFSFGILLLEIISGRNAIDVNFSPPSVVDWAVPLINRGDFTAICDALIGPPSDPIVARNLAVLAARCVRSTAGKRPGMMEVVEELKAVRKRVEAPSIWRSLRKRVGKPRRLVERTSEEAVSNENYYKAVRMGSRRNSKVSSVSSVEYRNDRIGRMGEKVIRSKSVGSFGDIKMGSDLSKKSFSGLAVKLRKSRSMGNRTK